MNKRIPQYLSAAVLVFLLFFAVLMVISAGFSNLGNLFAYSAPTTIAYLIVLALIGTGFVGQLRAKKWGYKMTAIILAPVALIALVASIFFVGALWLNLSDGAGSQPTIGESITTWAVIVFPLLVIATIVALIRYIRQQK